MIKRKPTPLPALKKPPVVTPEGLMSLWHRHPKMTLATVATIITILTSIAPFVSAWINDFIRRVEFNEYKTQALRDDRWRDVRAYRIEATMARNRLNDCNILKQNKHVLSSLERAVCDQYEQDMNDANHKLMEAQSKAMAISQGSVPEERTTKNP
jgi:hypothetical protein